MHLDHFSNDPGCTMASMFLQHRVKDYNVWRRTYDSAADMQKEGGVTAQAVYRAEGDPNTVLVYHKFATIAKARAFMANPALRDAMQKAGVDEKTLRVEFYNEA